MFPEFGQMLLRPENLLIICATWVIIKVIGLVFPHLNDSVLWVRLLPVTPIAVCSILVWLPGVIDEPWATRLLLGLVLGSLSTQGHKILRQTVFGNDARIRRYPQRF